LLVLEYLSSVDTTPTMRPSLFLFVCLLVTCLSSLAQGTTFTILGGGSVAPAWDIQGFYPSMLNITTGDSVQMVVNGGGSCFCFTPDFSISPIDPTTGTYSTYFLGTGGTVVNTTDEVFCSGIVLGGNSVVYEFPNPGSYPFFDLLHPIAQGVVVVTSSTPPESPSQVNTTALAQLAADIATLPSYYNILNLGATNATATQNSDGTWTHYVNIGGGINGVSLKAEWLRFTPTNLTITVGDSVNFTLAGVTTHSVAFNSSGVFNDQNELVNGVPAPNPNYLLPTGNPKNYQSGFVSSGYLVPSSTARPSFKITFNATGVFPYICSIHEILGMTGTITVNEASAAAALALFATLPTIILALLLLLL
jgi:plastocyanin